MSFIDDITCNNESMIIARVFDIHVYRAVKAELRSRWNVASARDAGRGTRTARRGRRARHHSRRSIGGTRRAAGYLPAAGDFGGEAASLAFETAASFRRTASIPACSGSKMPHSSCTGRPNCGAALEEGLTEGLFTPTEIASRVPGGIAGLLTRRSRTV